jgi:hypothetical protein
MLKTFLILLLAIVLLQFHFMVMRKFYDVKKGGNLKYGHTAYLLLDWLNYSTTARCGKYACIKFEENKKQICAKSSRTLT